MLNGNAINKCKWYKITNSIKVMLRKKRQKPILGVLNDLYLL